jgi:hypothetical protein
MHKASNNNKVNEKDYNSNDEGNNSPRWGEWSPTNASFMNIAKISFQQMGKILIAVLHSRKYWKCQQNPIVIEKGL